jgi:hypothetical protein
MLNCSQLISIDIVSAPYKTHGDAMVPFSSARALQFGIPSSSESALISLVEFFLLFGLCCRSGGRFLHCKHPSLKA